MFPVVATAEQVSVTRHSAVSSFLEIAMEKSGDIVEFRAGLKWVRDTMLQTAKGAENQARRRCITAQAFTWCYDRFQSTPYKVIVSTAVAVSVYIPPVWRACAIPDTFLPLLQLLLACSFVVLVSDVIATAVFLPKEYPGSWFFFFDLVGSMSPMIQWPDAVGTQFLALGTIVAMLRYVRLSRNTRLVRWSRMTRSLRATRLLKMMRVQRFTETVTYAAITALVLLAALGPLLNLFKPRVQPFVSIMADSLAQLSPEQCDTFHTTAPNSSDYALLSDTECEEILEYEIYLWFEAINSIAKERRTAVIYVNANNRSFINPFETQLRLGYSGLEACAAAAATTGATAEATTAAWASSDVLEACSCSDLEAHLPKQLLVLKSVSVTRTHTVEVFVDTSHTVRASALHDLLMVVMLSASVYWLAVFVREMSRRFVIIPLQAILDALDDAFPGTFPNVQPLSLQVSDKGTLAHRHEVNDELHNFIHRLIRIANLRRSRLPMAERLVESNVDRATRSFLEELFMVEEAVRSDDEPDNSDSVSDGAGIGNGNGNGGVGGASGGGGDGAGDGSGSGDGDDLAPSKYLDAMRAEVEPNNAAWRIAKSVLRQQEGPPPADKGAVGDDNRSAARGTSARWVKLPANRRVRGLRRGRCRRGGGEERAGRDGKFGRGKRARSP